MLINILICKKKPKTTNQKKPAATKRDGAEAD